MAIPDPTHIDEILVVQDYKDTTDDDGDDDDWWLPFQTMLNIIVPTNGASNKRFVLAGNTDLTNVDPATPMPLIDAQVLVLSECTGLTKCLLLWFLHAPSLRLLVLFGVDNLRELQTGLTMDEHRLFLSKAVWLNICALADYEVMVIFSLLHLITLMVFFSPSSIFFLLKKAHPGQETAMVVDNHHRYFDISKAITKVRWCRSSI